MNLRILYLISFLIFLTLEFAAYMIFKNIAINSGILVGYVVSLLPFLSWQMIMKITKNFSQKQGVLITVLIGLAKFILIAILLYFVLAHEFVNIYACVAGLGVMIPSSFIFSLIK